MPEDTLPPIDLNASPETEDLRAKLDAAEKDLANHKLQLAEYINARKRLIQSAEIERKYASESLVKDLLSALDNLDRALEAAKKAGDTGPLAIGVSATAVQFLDVLRRHGVTRIETNPGDAFDPNRHQAVSQQSAEGIESGHVASVLQQGFLLHDRVLRPAAVIVAS
jgi:molecular chaperone GrpE